MVPEGSKFGNLRVRRTGDKAFRLLSSEAVFPSQLTLIGMRWEEYGL
jgi:hypothetical protein